MYLTHCIKIQRYNKIVGKINGILHLEVQPNKFGLWLKDQKIKGKKNQIKIQYFLYGDVFETCGSPITRSLFQKYFLFYYKGSL